MKKQNGITLIALIITIIVMLILVGVTINVALNGGLFDKAKTAQEQTQRETDKEQLLSAVIGTLNDDGTVNEAELQAHLPDNFKYENGVYKNKVTGKEYTVDTETGKVTEVTNSNSDGSGDVENILKGKVFVMDNWMIDADTPGTLEFDNEKATQKNKNGVIEYELPYIYNSENHEIEISGIKFKLSIVEENKNIVNMIMTFGSSISTTNKAYGIIPIVGQFKNNDNNKTIEFINSNGYGYFTNGTSGDGSILTEPYCVIEDIAYYGEHGDTFTYTKDENGNFTSVTIDGITYTRID